MTSIARSVREMSNPAAERVRAVKRLAGRSARRREGVFLAEGPQAAREAIRTGKATQLYISQAAAERWPELLADANVPTWLCSAEVMAAMGEAETSQGVLAIAPIAPSALSQVLAGDLVVVLVELQDPGNVGTIIRAAEAAGATGIVATTGCADVWSPKCVRATAGSVFHIPLATGCDQSTVLTACAAAGLTTLAASGHGGVTTHDLLHETLRAHSSALTGPHAWFVGNEARGLPDEVSAAADATVAVPIRGRAESLNAAMAATVCLYTSALARDLASPPAQHVSGAQYAERRVWTQHEL